MADAAAVLDRLASGEGRIYDPLLVMVAHPDDEVIGLGGQLPRFRDAAILHTTDGAPRDGRDVAMHGFADPAAYAAARRRELHAALRLAGIGAERALELGVPDQQAALHLPDLARAIARVVADRRPALIVTHAYEGGHPDHDATAFAVHAALRLLGPSRRPALLEMAGYHAGPGGGMAVGRFLPAEGGGPPVPIALSPEARVLKRRMIACFATQRAVLSAFPVGDAEGLRPAPRHDFARPPHPGRLHYENHPWGMTGARFRRFAAEALRDLGLEGAA
jgi:N-acetylglucosamine malate deacetylase 2